MREADDREQTVSQQRYDVSQMQKGPIWPTHARMSSRQSTGTIARPDKP